MSYQNLEAVVRVGGQRKLVLHVEPAMYDKVLISIQKWNPEREDNDVELHFNLTFRQAKDFAEAILALTKLQENSPELDEL